MREIVQDALIIPGKGIEPLASTISDRALPLSYPSRGLSHSHLA